MHAFQSLPRTVSNGKAMDCMIVHTLGGMSDNFVGNVHMCKTMSTVQKQKAAAWAVPYKPDSKQS